MFFAEVIFVSMKKKIENPKVFISYAWGNEEYQHKVLSFASQLVSDGVDVVFDKWNLTEGNDTFAFMEKCVNDSTITNVLMLLDPIYAKKANEHSGGVGTETQIISAEVYKEVTQDRFIPIIMERNDKGEICKPTYLVGRLHFDLSVPDSYDTTYQRLVKTLFGEVIYAKPELGKKPNWVSNPIIIPTKSIVAYSSLKTIQPERVRKDSFKAFLLELGKELIDYTKVNSSINNSGDYINLYDATEEIKNRFLQLIQFSPYIFEGHKDIASFFEKTKNALENDNKYSREVVDIRIHEMFIYSISYFLKCDNYSAIGYLLGKTYFGKTYNTDYGAISFDMFYSGAYQNNLDQAIRERDKKRYYNGAAQHWIETISNDFCTKKQFVFADLICFNYCIYGQTYLGSRNWFPITYVYDNEFDGQLRKWCSRMVSKEFVMDVLPLFGYDSIEGIINKFKEVESMSPSTYREYRYSEAFSSASILGNYITSDKIATMK